MHQVLQEMPGLVVCCITPLQTTHRRLAAVQSLNDKIPGEAKKRERAVAEVVATLRKCLQAWVSGSNLETCVQL